jgi:hypothetical protein
LNKPDDWVHVTLVQMRKLGATRLVEGEYGGSLRAALQAVYPEHKWQEWDFDNAGRGFWKQKVNRVKFGKWMEERLAITKPEEWYAITPERMKQVGGSLIVLALMFASTGTALKPIGDGDNCSCGRGSARIYVNNTNCHGTVPRS